MTISNKPFVLIVLDGFGHRESPEANAILQANTPYINYLWETYPHTLLEASGLDVGLPEGQMGNSEVGHLNLGAGRIVYQELTRLDLAIRDGIFGQHLVWQQAFKDLVVSKKALHVFGLLSDGGVHSHQAHIFALIQAAAAAGVTKIYLHAFLDGRDTPPKSAAGFLQAAEETFKSLKVGKIASIVGRYYAMDRDQRFDRTQLAYELLTQSKADYSYASALEGLEAAYQRGENDEFVKPTVIGEPVSVQAGDAIIFMNFRADRARQLTHAFVDETYAHFSRGPKLALSHFITLTEYEANLPVTVVYPPATLTNVLGQVVADRGLKQLRIAETEKYAHVTFFFNGGQETPFVGEERQLIASPKVATYDLQPEMSAVELTDALIKAIEDQKFDLIICNYANADMVGHSGCMPATIEAIEALDACLGRVYQALKSVGGEMLITADHGNAELMEDAVTHQPHTAHTNQPVPLMYIGREAAVTINNGRLSDVAPTLLSLMDLPIPTEMDGRVLFRVV